MKTKFYSFLSYVFLSMFDTSSKTSRSKNNEHEGVWPSTTAKEKP